MVEVAAEKSSTLIFPVPVELLRLVDAITPVAPATPAAPATSEAPAPAPTAPITTPDEDRRLPSP
jgi:hypothetical protein